MSKNKNQNGIKQTHFILQMPTNDRKPSAQLIESVGSEYVDVTNNPAYKFYWFNSTRLCAVDRSN